MYLGVDIGGTKTLVAALNEQAVITEKHKFATPQKYTDFAEQLSQTLATFKTQDFQITTVAVPGQIDRKHGAVLRMGNLPWRHEPIEKDVEHIVNCPVLVENDANLAGLSEAKLLNDFETVLYITVSTGINTALIYKQHLDRATIRGEGGHIMLPFKGKFLPWEDFASGQAIYKHFGKYAADIPASDTKAWRYVARNLALGLYEHIAIEQPDIVVIGGSIGTYFDRYGKLLVEEIERYSNPMVNLPKIIGAKRPEEAVIYGCFDLAVQEAKSHATTN